MIHILFSLGSVFPTRVPKYPGGLDAFSFCLHSIQTAFARCFLAWVFRYGLASFLLAWAEYGSSGSYGHSYGAFVGGLVSCLLAVSFGLHIVLWSETE